MDFHVTSSRNSRAGDMANQGDPYLASEALDAMFGILATSTQDGTNETFRIGQAVYFPAGIQPFGFLRQVQNCCFKSIKQSKNMNFIPLAI